MFIKLSDISIVFVLVEHYRCNGLEFNVVGLFSGNKIASNQFLTKESANGKHFFWYSE